MVCMCDEDLAYPYMTLIVHKLSHIFKKQLVSLGIISGLYHNSIGPGPHYEAISTAQCKRARVFSRDMINEVPESLIE